MLNALLCTSLYLLTHMLVFEKKNDIIQHICLLINDPQFLSESLSYSQSYQWFESIMGVWL